MIATRSITVEEAEAELSVTRHCLDFCPQITLIILLQILSTASKYWVIEDELDDIHRAFFSPFSFFLKLSDLNLINLWSVFRNEIL